MSPSKPNQLFLYMASYAPWHTSPIYPQRLIRCLEEANLLPERLDDRDPPRRRFMGAEHVTEFWFAKREGAGPYLRFERLARPNPYELIVHWCDLKIELYRDRGDYHYLYMSSTADDADAVVAIWGELCRSMHPFHAFLDTEERYNVRAHEVSPDGHVTKQTGWYLRRLPGFFAHNYFGDVYLRGWGSAIPHIPATLTVADANGLFVVAPSGLDHEGGTDELYSPDDLAVIQTLGPEWFRLPTQGIRNHAPSLDEFIAATPNPA